MTTPTAFRKVPNKMTLYASSSFKRSWAEISAVKGAIVMDFMKVLGPYGGGLMSYQVLVLCWIRYYDYDFAA